MRRVAYHNGSSKLTHIGTNGLGLSHALGGIITPPAIPANALTMNGQELTLNGQTLTLGA